MGMFFTALLIILGAIYVVNYIRTLPERRENEERIRRIALLYEEKCKVEKAKQNARVAGEIARTRINEIAKK